MIQDIIQDARSRMQKCVEAFQVNLTKLRTGRAHPSLLEHLVVEYYGTPTALNQVANITIENSRTLAITPWEKNMVGPIEKAILTSDLGLNPATSGTLIRVPLPPLNEERRHALTKVVRDEAEKARVSARNVRRDAMHDVKELLKAKDINEDDERKAEQEIQKITDETVKQIDAVCAAKEKDLLEV